MKINEVEALVGITKKNIRFYEAEGLLTPRRNSENGYRDYGEVEVETLRRIKLLRKLGFPLEQIRQMQTGSRTVGDGMRRHLVTLEREQENLRSAAQLCAGLTDCAEKLDMLLSSGTADEKGSAAAIEELCDSLIKEIIKDGFCSSCGDYIEHYAYKIRDRISSGELRNMPIVI